MRHAMLVGFFAFASLVFPAISHAQAAAAGIAIAQVLSALESAIRALNTTIETAGAEVRSSGASLTANAQNLVVDINHEFGGKLTQTVGELKGAQRQLIDDAIVLTRQMQQATSELTNNVGAQARRTLQEADITAYNASYSLPCRTLTPRVVYLTPESLRRGTDVSEVKLRGNFLDIGAAPAVSVAGKPARVLGRSRNELSVELPAEVVAAVQNPGSVSISFVPEENSRTNLWVYCYERNRKLDQPLVAQVELRPELTYALAGTIRGVYTTFTPWTQSFDYNRSDNDCGASFDDIKQYCAPEGYTLTPANFASVQVRSANCNSSVGTPTVAGPRCVNVSAHLGGCGYDNIAFGIRNCRGRGWFDYRVTVNAQLATPTNMADTPFALESRDGKQKSFQATHSEAAQNHQGAVYTYAVTINVNEGSRTVRTISAGSGNPNPVGANTRMAAGTVYINID